MEHRGFGIAGVKHNLEVFPVVVGNMVHDSKDPFCFPMVLLRHYSYAHNFIRLAVQLYSVNVETTMP